MAHMLTIPDRTVRSTTGALVIALKRCSLRELNVPLAPRFRLGSVRPFMSRPVTPCSRTIAPAAIKTQLYGSRRD